MHNDPEAISRLLIREKRNAATYVAISQKQFPVNECLFSMDSVRWLPPEALPNRGVPIGSCRHPEKWLPGGWNRNSTLCRFPDNAAPSASISICLPVRYFSYVFHSTNVTLLISRSVVSPENTFASAD